MTKRRCYHSWGFIARWLPFPILLWASRRIFGNNHVWYQDASVQLVLMPFEGKGAYHEDK